jgi:transposase
MIEQDLLGLLLPEGMLDYFELTDVEKRPDSYLIHLSERNIPPASCKDCKLASKGFYEPATIQDFPLRGRACYLKVRRRRWLNEATGAIVMRDWSVVAKGTRMTAEFAAFLKELNRYHPGKL